MATLADGGRITAGLVSEEIARCADAAPARGAGGPETDLAELLGEGFASRYDDFDLAQLAHVVEVCRASESAADAARKLYAVSFRAKKSSNSSDRLSKYLARFGLKFKTLPRA